MSKLDDEIRARVEAFVSDISDLIRRAALETVKEALSSPARPLRAPRLPAPARKKASDRGRRSAGELAKTQARLLAQVTAKPGQRIDQIAKELGLSTKELALPARKLIADKAIATKGQKRATTYWVK
jgi:hypothetical protein